MFKSDAHGGMIMNAWFCMQYLLIFGLLLQQVDPEVFAALPRELQEELRSAYRHRENTQAQGTVT